MNIKEVLQLGRDITNDKVAKLALEVLLGYCLSKNKEYLFAHPEDEVDDETILRFTSLAKRHLNGEPVAYLTGEKEFYGLRLDVDKRVLIPRPETEFLIEKTEKLLRECKRKNIYKMLDVGTGSGNIAIALAHAIPEAQITACDVSLDALQVAKKNVSRYNLEERVHLVHSDLLKDIPEDDYCIVVANLPYIGTEKHNFVSKETKNFEPHEALYGGYDGLRLYEDFLDQLNRWSSKPRYILGEIGFLQGEELRKMVKQFYPEASVAIEKDLSGLDRYFIIHSL